MSNAGSAFSLDSGLPARVFAGIFAAMNNPFRARTVSRLRMVTTLLLAAGLDGLQLALGPLGWTFLDEVLDVIGLVVFSLLLGFHPLLLPTFVVELFPLVDMLPTWTGCVGAVVMWRRSKSVPQPKPAAKNADVTGSQSQPPTEDKGPIIDV